jgi:putative ATP-dependent endonuclease of OLD family
MRVTKFIIKNVKSFGEETPISLSPGLNILIGPNAGGKSNLFDIINFSLNYFFIHTWRITEQRSGEGFLLRRNLQNLQRAGMFGDPGAYLDKHDRRKSEPQEIKVRFLIQEGDVRNIQAILDSKNELCSVEKETFESSVLQNEFINSVQDYNIGDIENKEVEFTVKDNSVSRSQSLDTSEDKSYDIVLRYLNSFELFSLLVQEHNATHPDKRIPRLYPPLIYFSPYRMPQSQHLVTRLAGSDHFNLMQTYKQNTSKNVSSTFELANHYFARKLRLLNNNLELFRKDEEVTFVNNYIQKLGYKEFTLREIDPLNNVYQVCIEKINGELFEVSKASSGEKEVLNMLLGIFAFNVKNGVVIIDEPDLHLHPLWQNMLLDLFFELSDQRGVQFMLATHSPTFITRRSIRNTLRVYALNGESKVVVPPTLDESEKDLFQIINVFNNAKIFFADKVVLVEGDVDNLIYHSILRKLQPQSNKMEVIEILDVKGKSNLEKFKKFLDKWQITSYRIADKDYTSADGKNLFILTLGGIEAYFSYMNKSHFDIADAIRIAEDIESGRIQIHEDLEEIFRKIISETAT